LLSADAGASISSRPVTNAMMIASLSVVG